MNKKDINLCDDLKYRLGENSIVGLWENPTIGLCENSNIGTQKFNHRPIHKLDGLYENLIIGL